MKFSTIALSLATAGSIVNAQPHRHHHRHADRHERRADPVDVATVTQTAYMDQSGKPMPAGEVADGLANGKLTLVEGKAVPAPAPAAITPASKPVGNQFFAKPVESSPLPSPPKSSAPAPSPSSSPAANTGSSTGTGGYTSSGVDSDFPDGSVDCSHFPQDYGAVPIEYLKLGGWTGIQDGNKGYANGVPGGKCGAGGYCSYACPVGYQKAQWPTDQGSLGQSVGGLKCGTDNKLHLTNSGFSKKLCVKGVGGVSIVNKLGKGVAVCRTDYPGTEGETIPATFDINAQKYDLTTPDEDTYYKHQNLPTSAQYYINPAGYDLDKACVWGDSTSNLGNRAPLNIGTGKKAGLKWLGILPNAPTNPGADLGFRVRIVGQGIADKACYYEYPNICAGSTCISVKDTNTKAGCTVSTAGEASYEFY